MEYAETEYPEYQRTGVYQTSADGLVLNTILIAVLIFAVVCAGAAWFWGRVFRLGNR